MKKPFGVCVIGCGYMGTIHAERWQAVPEAKITAVVDIIPERAAALAHRTQSEAYLDYREALARLDVDVVSVCIPTNQHAEASIAALELGKHVLCEKPIARTLEQADAMIAAAEAHQVKLGLGFMRRHSPVVQDLKARLAAGELGRPVLYNAADIREIRPKLAMHGALVNGGPVIDMAVHLIDLWNTIFDSHAVSVSAQGLKLGQDRSELAGIDPLAIDTATVLVKYASGDIGTFVVCWGLPPKVNPPDRRDQIYAPRGLGEAAYGMRHQELLAMTEGGLWQTLSVSHEDMFQNEIKAFARWVLDEETFPASGEDGKAALRVALAAIQAIETGQTIQL